jgi:hypothetical protein
MAAEGNSDNIITLDNIYKYKNLKLEEVMKYYNNWIFKYEKCYDEPAKLKLKKFLETYYDEHAILRIDGASDDGYFKSIGEILAYCCKYDNLEVYFNAENIFTTPQDFFSQMPNIYIKSHTHVIF